MATHIYREPVARLLTYGEARHGRPRDRWPDYRELGLADEHVSELIRMATDAELNGADGESSEIWAPLHAWRTLGQLRAEEAAEPLVRLFDVLDDDDWVADELPKVFAMIGPAAIATLAAFLDDTGIDERRRVPVPECLEQIARRHPGARVDCIAALAGQLAKYRANGSKLNGFLVCALVGVRATGTMDIIREAFAEDLVDAFIGGDVEDIEIEMGLRKYRSTPPPRRDVPGFGLGFERAAARTGPVRLGPKIGRNEPCPCGSGKKFKKCCMY